MGMAASQARLLSITSRMADNELKAQIINNSKMRLATESSRVSENYINALNSATMMFTNYNTAGDSQYQKLTFNSLTAFSPYNNQYALINPNGQILVSEKEDRLFREAMAAEGDPLEAYLFAHDLEKKTTYFDKNSACPDTFEIQGLDQKNQPYHVKDYSREDLAKAYEEYGETLQSSKYEEFTNLYNNYSLKDVILTGAVEQSLKENLLNKAFNYGSTNTKGLPFKGYMDGLLNNEANNKNSRSAYNALLDMINYCVAQKYMTKGADLYKDINDSLSFTSNNEILLSSEEEVAEENGSYSFRYSEIGNDKDDTVIKCYDYTISPSDDGYEIKSNIEAGRNTTSIIEPSTISEDNLYNATFTITETATVKDEESGKDISIKNTYYYKTSKDSNGELEITVEYKISDPSEVNDAVKTLYNEFKECYVSAMKEGYTKKVASAGYNADKDLKDKYDDQQAAKEALMNYIFGDKVKDVNKDLTGHLDDIPWLIANCEEFFSDDFKDVEKIFVLDQLFDEFGEPAYGWVDNSNPTADADAKVTWYTNLFNRMQKGYRALEDGLASSNTWIQFALESGLATMEQVDKTNNWVGTLHTNCSDISEVTDDVAVARAEAEYKKAMNNIENKDKRFDIELKNIDTEHNSLQKEYESVKKVIDKNIQRTFKMYS